MSETDFVQCRTFGHAWEEGPDDRVHDARVVWKWALCLRCVRCDTRRYDAIDAYGDVAQRQYVYPEGYQYATADDRPSRTEFRLMLLKDREK